MFGRDFSKGKLLGLWRISLSISPTLCSSVHFQVELFLFFTNIVHQYNIEPQNVGVIPTEEYQQGKDD